MKILMTCTPGLGHFHPMVPLAHALRDAAHGVTFVTSESFRPWIERAGLPTVTAGADWIQSAPERAFPDIPGSPYELQDLKTLVTASFYRAATALLPQLLQLVETTQPDVLIHEQEEFTTPLVGERAGVPWATVGLCYRLPIAVSSRRSGSLWSDARVRFGLTPDPDAERLWPYLYLDSYPASLHPVLMSDAMRVAHPMRPIPYEVTQEETPPWLDRLPERPTVYVTMGTIFNRVRGVFAEILEGLAKEDVNVLITVGPTGDPADLGPQPSHVYVARYIPQSVVLPHVDLVISHGGRSTVLAALAHGVPSVLLPLGSDQFYNAFRVAACGAGLTLDRSNVTPGDVRQAARTVLDEPLYRLNAQRIAREIEAMPGPPAAVGHLEKLARDKAPIPTAAMATA